MRLRILLRGILGTMGIRLRNRGTKGTNSARYCYSVFLRHLYYLNKNGYEFAPNTIAELGPGDSLGIGLTAMLCGANEYYAFDIIDHASTTENLKIFDELVTLFQNREPIPDNREFPFIKPDIESFKFPNNILTDEIINRALDLKRVSKIREALVKGQSSDIIIKYIVPWDKHNIQNETIDLIFSQAVMEHVIKLESAYLSMYSWLKKGGIISHEIDYSAHETHTKWNGHWYFSKFLWRIILNGRSYSINRFPHSIHKKLVENWFHIISEIKDNDNSGSYKKINSNNIYKKDDFTVRSALIQAVKLSSEKVPVFE